MELQDLSSHRSKEPSTGNPLGEQSLKPDLEQRPSGNPPDQEIQASSSIGQQSITAPRTTNNRLFRLVIRISPQKWWARHISLVVAHTSHAPTGGDPRDYLALERTYLAYVRTSTAVVHLGVVVTQLFVLKKVDPRTGSILGAVATGGGIVMTLIGCARYFKQQKRLTHGKSVAAGWDVVTVWAIVVAILSALFVVVLAQK